MYRIINHRIATLMFPALFFSSVAFSQFDNIEFLKSAPADGVKFLEAYFGPWANAFGAGLNGSWYNSAKPHALGGFDITFGINAGIVPVSAETFDVSSLGLSNSLTGSGLAPTIAGPQTDGPEIVLSESGVELARFNTPQGTAWRYIPVPTAQVGIGLPLGTELKIRFIPRVPIKDGDVMLWGVGLMHSIMQYIPGNELLPVDASIFAGYTRLNGNVPLSLEPGSPTSYISYDPFSDFEGQNLEVAVQALNVSAIASFNLPVISFYGGLGYSRTSTIFNLSGYFPTPSLVTTPTPQSQYNDAGVIDGSDFPEMKMENFSGLRANIGFRIKLAVITFHADYTRAQYSVLSAGIGVSFR